MWNFPIKWRANKKAAALADQLEDLLHQVWECDRWWRLEDRLDLAARVAIPRHTGSDRSNGGTP